MNLPVLYVRFSMDLNAPNGSFANQEVALIRGVRNGRFNNVYLSVWIYTRSGNLSRPP